jgi:alkanesulfonate monooxygenase SsuD/methylene tetrahydromethanopterin reductase-like flavin-dependent oxidoreductase (luciferase family)
MGETIMAQSLDALVAAHDAGCHGVWVGEHLLAARPRYQNPWPDPSAMLGALSARLPESAALGTAIMVAPLYSAAMISRLAWTLGVGRTGPIRLGLGAGWNEDEFIVHDRDFKRRGRDLDRVLSQLRWLWHPEANDGESAFEGIDRDDFAPTPNVIPQIWIGAGANPGADRLPEPLARRLSIGDGWLVNPNTRAEDLESVMRNSKARDPAAIDRERVIRMAYIHAPEPHATTAKALDQQLAAFQNLFGSDRGPDYVKEHCLVGHHDQVMESVRDSYRFAAELVVIPVPFDPIQIGRIADLMKHINLQ